MPQFHGVTIGLGVTLLTPTADGVASQAIVTDGAGTLSFSTVGAASPLTLTASSSSEIPLTLKAATGQTANLLEWQDSSSNVMGRIRSDGSVVSIDALTIWADRPYEDRGLHLTAGNGWQATKLSTTGSDLWIEPAGNIWLSKNVQMTKISTNDVSISWDYNHAANNFLEIGTSTASTTDEYGNGVKILSQNANASAVSNVTGQSVYIRPGAGTTSVTDGTIELGTDGSSTSGTIQARVPLHATAETASDTPVTIKAATSQTADLQQWTDSSDNVMARVKSDGTIRAGAAYLKSAGSYFWEIGTEDSGYGAAIKGVGSSGIEIHQKTELMQGAAFDGTCNLPQIPVIIDSVATGGGYSDGNNNGYVKGMEGGAYASPDSARHAGNLIIKCFDGNNTGASTSDGGIGGHIRNIYGQGGAGIAGGTDGADGYWQVESSAGTVAIKTDWSTTAGDTRFLIYDVDNATLERVTVGAADSGGTGYKVLRIAN